MALTVRGFLDSENNSLPIGGPLEETVQILFLCLPLDQQQALLQTLRQGHERVAAARSKRS